MAQGDIFIFDYFVYSLLTKPWGVNTFWPRIGLLPQTIIPEIDHDPDDWKSYNPQLERQVTFSYLRDSDETQLMAAPPIVFEIVSENHLAAKVKYALLYQRLAQNRGSFAFIDLTDDEGETPWDLTKVPLRITFGETVFGGFNKVSTVTVE